METTTSEIRQRLFEQQKGKLLDVARDMRQSGSSNRDIQRMVKNHIRMKEANFYNNHKDISSISNFIGQSLQEILGIKPDSKAEMIFYEAMKASGVKFEFQYSIGPYRADYLVGDRLVIELDGPQHRIKEQRKYDEDRDAYMINLGYDVLRLDLSIVAMDVGAAVDAIKELSL